MADTVSLPSQNPTEDIKAEYHRLHGKILALLNRKEFPVALHELNESESQYIAASDTQGQAIVSFLRGVYYRFAQELPRSLAILQESQEKFASFEDRQWTIFALIETSITLFNQGQYGNAQDGLTQCIALCRQIGDKRNEMKAIFNLSTYYKQSGDIAASQEMFFQCLPYFEELGDTNTTAKVLLSIANNYNILKNPSEVIRFAERGIVLLESQGDDPNLALALCIQGTGHINQHEYETALSYFQRGLSFAEKSGIPWIAALALSDMGDTLISLKRFEEARIALERSLTLNSSKGHLLAYCEAVGRLGRLHIQEAYAERDEQRALECLMEARQIAEGNDVAILLTTIYTDLISLYERQGELKQALDTFRALHSIDKRVFNEDSDQRTKGLQIRFDVERAQKDAEIAHLRSVELAGALAEAERLKSLADERAEYNQRIAATLQESVQPTIAENIATGLSIRTFYRPASDEAAVGGDFYDVFPLSKGKTVLVVGDVIGHGLEAALSISEVRFALRAFLSQNPDGDIGETLRQLNNFLVTTNQLKAKERKDSNGYRLVALTLVTIDLTKKELGIVAAGMEPALLLRWATGSIEPLDAGDMILGAFPNTDYKAKRVAIEPQDLLAITTDGITEAFSAEGQRQFGLQGLGQILSHLAFSDRSSLQIIGEEVLSTVQGFVGNPFRDDICLLLTRIDRLPGT